MRPGPDTNIACPHCGKIKHLMGLSSGNTFLTTLWSDTKTISPMLPRLSVIQKCPNCNQYSLLKKWNKINTNDHKFSSKDLGLLTYEDMKEAYRQLIKNTDYNNEDRLTICKEFILSYNDNFFRDEWENWIERQETRVSIEDTDLSLFLEASDLAIKLLDDKSLIFKAELLRERKEFKEANKILKNNITDENRWIIEPMLYFCKQFRSTPFILINKGATCTWGKEPNFNTIIECNTWDELLKRKAEADTFMTAFENCYKVSSEHDGLGGIYTGKREIFLRLFDSCPEQYEINNKTKSISPYALFCNFKIKSIKFPESLHSIGEKAFYGCKNLQECTCTEFEPKIGSINTKAFMNCKNLEMFPSNFLKHVRFIGESAFAGMDKLKQIELPEGLTSIPDFCFASNVSLTNILFPSTIHTIGKDAFFGTGIRSIILPDLITDIGSAAFCNCRQLKDIKLSNTLTGISQRMFSGCDNLKYIEIPVSVKRIEDLAFNKTKALSIIRFRGKVEKISIDNSLKSKHIIVPRKFLDYYKENFGCLKFQPDTIEDNFNNHSQTFY